MPGKIHDGVLCNTEKEPRIGSPSFKVIEGGPKTKSAGIYSSPISGYFSTSHI